MTRCLQGSCPQALYIRVKHGADECGTLEAVFAMLQSQSALPLQVMTEYYDSHVDTLLQITEKMHAHLTAAIVSNDVHFVQKMLPNTVNGTTYAGIRARCTGKLCSLLHQIIMDHHGSF